MRDLVEGPIETITSVALVGAPNCGKTSLFNALTGANQRVGNFSGVTVEHKCGAAQSPGGHRLSVIDLPGTHSLRARSPDEVVTREVILGQRRDAPRPDLLLVVADATHLRPGLRLAQELRCCGLPAVLVLNMIDIARHRGIEINLDRISAALGLPVIGASAVRRGGLTELWQQIDDLLEAGLAPPGPVLWTPPDAADLRAALRTADRIIARAVRLPPPKQGASARIDRVVLHPVAGPALLMALMFVLFQAVFAGAAPLMGLITAGFDALAALATAHLPAGLMQSLVVDGIIAGVGGVVIFLPQILILFAFILALEDFGYMARAAFLMDRLMGHAGLNGRAFIPLLSSFACAVPGIMSARVIDDRRDRLTTILIAPLMTCSARIPVYTLLIGAFVPDRHIGGLVGLQGLVMFGLYLAGTLAALAVAWTSRWLFRRHEIAAPLTLDLPDYRLPRARSMALGLWQRARAFLRRAGTTIFLASMAIWVLSTFPMATDGASLAPETYAFRIGHALEPLLAPVGFNWQIAVAMVPGMAAREVLVAGLGTVYAVSGGDAAAIGATLAANWSLATAFALIAWFIFAPQCFATLAVIRRETGSARWMGVALVYMFALAYAAAFVTWHVTRALTGG